MAPDGYFTDDSMLRRVVGDRVTALAGPRALLVMAAHPVAFAGFFAHTGALDDPYARLERTANVMNTVAFQNAPAHVLPPELRDENPLGIWRRVDGEPTL